MVTKTTGPTAFPEGMLSRWRQCNWLRQIFRSMRSEHKSQKRSISCSLRPQRDSSRKFWRSLKWQDGNKDATRSNPLFSYKQDLVWYLPKTSWCKATKWERSGEIIIDGRLSSLSDKPKGKDVVLVPDRGEPCFWMAFLQKLFPFITIPLFTKNDHKPFSSDACDATPAAVETPLTWSVAYRWLNLLRPDVSWKKP